MSPSASPIKKKPKPPTTGDMVDKMANTVAHFEDILRTELTAMQNEFACHMSVVQSLCSKLDLLTGEMREQKKVVADHDRRVAALEQQVVDLQDRNRRSNLRLVGLPEGSEKDDPMGFLKRSLPTWLPSLEGKEIEVERAHHVYTRLSSDHAKPQVFIFKLLRYTDREIILRAARLHALVKTSDGATLSFFPDFFPATAKRSAFAPVRKEMREAGIQNFLLYPATLKVILNQAMMSTADPFQDLVTALRCTHQFIHASTTSEYFRIPRCIFFAVCDRQSHGQTGSLLWLGGGLQRIHLAMFAGFGDATAPVPRQ
ncbi:LINE-1 type transposase domain-containing protein 1 [Anabarilius grahami]|uniref:LINE-1 type transposase domain-containing protein 1 n=1 Tax=Anabarilius grahami TaxID=495550 RepID=A0A3N0Y7T4_ANAGA|nr:LINE-1 type transposase domain-containing protein 1 [Anabarilius grahami]